MVHRNCIALGLAAAMAASGAPVGARQVFRSSIEYVSLDVVVTDKNDRPIGGLTRDDFVVRERGTAQTIAAFEAVSRPVTRIDTQAVTAHVAPMDVASNQPAPGAQQWVIVIDDLHIIEHHLRETKRTLQDLLEQIPLTDQVAILFVGRSDLSQGFSADRAQHLKAIDRIKSALGFAYDAADEGGAPTAAEQAAQQSFGGASGTGQSQAGSSAPLTAGKPSGAGGDISTPTSMINANSSERHRFADATIDMLNRVTQAMAASSAPRKAVVYISEGATYGTDHASYSGQLDFGSEAEFARDYIRDMANVFDTARRSGVPVYAIDPRGPVNATFTRGFAEPPWPNIRNQSSNMRALAENTGGIAIVGASDMTRMIEMVVHDNEHYYLIGFYPEPLVRDGKFHDVDVTVKNHPEYRVRARAGYTAPGPVPAQALDLNEAFNAALAATLPVAGFALKVQAAPLSRGNKGFKTAVVVQVHYPLPPDRAKIDDTLEFAIIAADADGKTKASARQAYRFTATPSRGQDGVFTIDHVIELPSQPLTLRVGIASHASGRIGVVDVPVEPRRDSDDISLGAVMLGYAGPAREDARPKNAFAGLVPFQPTTDRTFAGGDTIRVFAPARWRGQTPATVTLTVRRGGQVLGTTRDQLDADAVSLSSGMTESAFTTALPMRGLAPGEYVLSVSLSAGTRALSRDIGFVVRP